MTRLTWGTPGERLYETGLDQGVLYINGSGVPWNGLVAVNEISSGGEIGEYFLDGVKYAQSNGVENFEATLDAYSSPVEFDQCDGSLEYRPGLMATRQRRYAFDLSYRTKVGNDLDGLDLGYKIHLVYNAFVGIAERNNTSIQEEIEPLVLSWPIKAIPESVPGFRPTAHFVIESLKADPTVLSNLEDALYGTESTDPYMPSIEEVITIFTDEAVFTVTDNADGTWTATGPENWVHEVDSTTFTITSPSIITTGADTYTISSV